MHAQSVNPSSPDDGSPLESLVRGVVEREGYELESLEVGRAGRRQLIRVIVDSADSADHAADAAAGISLDGVAAVSRAVAAELEEHDELLGGPYTLEVTSPGVDRPLTAARHWRRNRLRLVRARLADGGEVVGRVGDCDTEAVTLLVSGQLRRVAFAELDRAVVEVEFRPPPADELAALADGSPDGAASELEER